MPPFTCSRICGGGRAEGGAAQGRHVGSRRGADSGAEKRGSAGGAQAHLCGCPHCAASSQRSCTSDGAWKGWPTHLDAVERRGEGLGYGARQRAGAEEDQGARDQRQQRDGSVRRQVGWGEQRGSGRRAQLPNNVAGALRPAASAAATPPLGHIRQSHAGARHQARSPPFGRHGLLGHRNGLRLTAGLLLCR